MTTESPSQAQLIDQLRRQLATAIERFNQAQLLVFRLRCASAKKAGRKLWVREKDKSGLKAALSSGERQDLGSWSLIKPENVPLPNASLLSSLMRDLHAELGMAAPSTPAFAFPPSSSSSSSSYRFSKRFPPELFYHIIAYTSKSTNPSLCLVSSSFRAVASPQLYKSMTVSSPARLAPFLSSPLNSLAPSNPSITLGQVISLKLTVKCGHKMVDQAAEGGSYVPLSFPRLQHLFIQSISSKRDEPDINCPSALAPNLALATSFLSHLNPSSLAASYQSSSPSQTWRSFDVLRSVWEQATSTWTRLGRIALLDCCQMDLLEMSDFGRVGQGLLPSDLPRCRPSLLLQWSFSKRIGGYARESRARISTGH